MFILILYICILARLLSFVSGCEGPCITGVTTALVSNYSIPVNEVCKKLYSTNAQQQTCFDSYNENAYDAMREAIFPGFFHGKCQVNGVDPKGCPNPDCPVVCGTPGSIIHFYSTFVNIAFNTTTRSIANATEACENKQCIPKDEVKATRREVITNQETIRNMLLDECGGSGYPKCSWISQGMKPYVLSWP